MDYGIGMGLEDMFLVLYPRWSFAECGPLPEFLKAEEMQMGVQMGLQMRSGALFFQAKRKVYSRIQHK